jgi:hypothetical protein
MKDVRRADRSTQQEELIRRYCAEAERQLEKAPDYAAALQLKESLCAMFERECESSMVVAATRQYIEEALQRLWRGG